MKRRAEDSGLGLFVPSEESSVHARLPQALGSGPEALTLRKGLWEPQSGAGFGESLLVSLSDTPPKILGW